MVRRAQYRINGTGLQARRATDTDIFCDGGDLRRLRLAEGRIRGQRLLIEQLTDREYRGFAAGCAPVDRRLAGYDRFGIRPAARISALAALRLGQQSVDPLDGTRSIRRETVGCKAQCRSNDSGQKTE